MGFTYHKVQGKNYHKPTYEDHEAMNGRVLMPTPQ
jgi:hypothetical protein